MQLERFMKYINVDPMSGCWLWTGAIDAESGYGRLHDGKNKKAHREAWELFLGPIPVGQWVLHKCDTRACANPSHLFLGDAQSNVDDMIQKGRHSFGEKHSMIMRAKALRGERNHACRVPESTVEEIRRRWMTGFSQREIAKQFAINQSTVSRIVHMKSRVERATP